MPKYHSAGVYVTEIEQTPAPIEGVSASTANLVGAKLVGELQRLVDQIPLAGEQAGGINSSLALLELMAWITDSLVYRLKHLNSKESLHAARLVAASLALIENSAQPDESTVKRVRFFEGKLLFGENLQARESDLQKKAKSADDWGIKWGLEINVKENSDRPVIHISPGYAADNAGHAILLDKPVELSLPVAAKFASIIARSKAGGPMSIAVLQSAECDFLFVDEPNRDDLSLGRLEKSPNGWRFVNDECH